MEIKILDNPNIDRKKWEHLVSNDTYGFPYASAWYLDIVSPNWKAVVVNDYDVCLPLPWRKKHGITYIYPPSYSQQIGIIGKNKVSEQQIKEIIDYCASQYRYLEFNLNKHNLVKDEWNSYKNKWRRNLELDLSDSYSNIYNRFHKNTKRNIKKSKEANLRIERTENYDALISTFIDGKAKLLKGRDLDYKLLAQLIDRGKEKNQVEILNIKKDHVFLGSALFINHLKRKVFLFSAINAVGRANRAMFYLINDVIEKNAGSDLILDFEGSDDDKLATFYQRFGAKESLYLHLKINRLPFLLKWLKG